MNHKKTLLLLMDEYAEKPFGWDGDKALPIRTDSMNLVREIFHDPEFAAGRLSACSEASICLDTDGTIQIVLGYEDKHVLLVFHCGTAVSYSQFYAGRDSSIEGLIRSRSHVEQASAVRAVNSILEWLIPGYQGW